MLCEFGIEIIIGVHLEEFIFYSLCRTILEKKLRANAHLAITILRRTDCTICQQCVSKVNLRQSFNCKPAEMHSSLTC